MKLERKLSVFLTLLLTIIIGGIGFVNFRQIKGSIELQMGNNAMDMAVTIASLDEISDNLASEKGYEKIQELVEDIRVKTRFQYIIVMDMDGVKHSYPYVSGLDKKYQNGDEERVLSSGQSYISADRNKLISAIRAFTPIYKDGEQVGAVVVGLLIETVNQELKFYYNSFWMTLTIGLILGVLGALYLSNDIKKSTFGLDPTEIAMLLGEREIVLHSLKNGILAVNQYGEIQFFNKVAEDVLRLSDAKIGDSINDTNNYYGEKLKAVFDNKTSVFNEEVPLSNGHILLCSHNLLIDKNEDIIGVVSSFQDLTEVKIMAEELTGIRALMSAQRAQSHEFMNRLHTISGLIQLEEYEDAISYISEVSNTRREIITILTKNIENVFVAGHLLAKYNKASEKKIKFEVKPLSHLKELPTALTEDKFCSIIGNLIENSIDELAGRNDGEITIFVGYDGDDLIIEVEDNGRGIDEANLKAVFEKGYSTKDGSRGYGLFIVKDIVEQSGGQIDIENDCGAKWSIIIPMEVTHNDQSTNR
ncbi:MAG: sensor histidine kinase [Acidaminobacteraceae bacterium]